MELGCLREILVLKLNRPYLRIRKFGDVDLLDFVAFVSKHCGDVNLIPELGDSHLFFAGFDTVSVPLTVLCYTYTYRSVK